MIALRDCKTAKMYQCGMSRSKAQANGADMRIFDSLVAKYQDGSIPTGDWVGFSTPDCPDCACVQDGHCLCIPSKPAAQPAYSCEYHTGGQQGAQLRAICAQ